MSTPTVRPRRWTRHEYERLVESGVFGPDDHIELLDGEIVEMTPQGSRHMAIVAQLNRILGDSLPHGCHLRPQGPVALDLASEPEPDIAIVHGAPLEYLEGHPSEVLLVVEVSESSLAYDRGRKLGTYARNDVPEYWIVNLVDLRLEVYRQPVDERFTETAVLAAGDRVSPLFAPDVEIAVADLLP